MRFRGITLKGSYATYADIQGKAQARPFRFMCSDCRKWQIVPASDSCASGYGVSKENQFVCYPCCGKREQADLLATGKGYLYLSKDGNSHKLSNWPGSIVIRGLYVRKGRHNIARTRYDVWFSWQGFNWHGVQYGEWTQICHIKRVKA